MATKKIKKNISCKLGHIYIITQQQQRFWFKCCLTGRLLAVLLMSVHRSVHWLPVVVGNGL